jgi:hypothetical protein
MLFSFTVAWFAGAVVKAIATGEAMRTVPLAITRGTFGISAIVSLTTAPTS